MNNQKADLFLPYSDSFSKWLDEHMKKGGTDVPARLLTLLALLERLYEEPALEMGKHTAESGMQLIDHNSFVDRALAHFKIESPLKEKGRRSSNLHGWAQPLFTWLSSVHFEKMSDVQKHAFLRSAQKVAIQRVTVINEDKPLIARYNLGTAIAVIADILDQAQDKKRAKDVAEYLVGAKLDLRFGKGTVAPKNVNTPNRDQHADFQVGTSAIEVTVNPVDKRHIEQIKDILDKTSMQVWLLVRLKDREKWQNAVEFDLANQTPRVVVTDIETFIGQNISELGKFQTSEVRENLASLFQGYNETWLPTVGTGGLKIISLEPEQD